MYIVLHLKSHLNFYQNSNAVSSVNNVNLLLYIKPKMCSSFYGSLLRILSIKSKNVFANSIELVIQCLDWCSGLIPTLDIYSSAFPLGNKGLTVHYLVFSGET